MRLSVSLVSTRSLRAGVWALAGLIGAVSGVQAQDRVPGQLDATCASDCASRGYASDYCAEAYWIPDRPPLRADEVTDWRCMTACRDQGGRHGDCKPRCRIR